MSHNFSSPAVCDSTSYVTRSANRAKRVFATVLLCVACLMLMVQGGLAQTFTTCTGQTILSISGATTSTITNSTGNAVNVRITARGGDGGTRNNVPSPGGSGATMIGEFVLANGATIRAISGGIGSTGTSSAGAGGGSGTVDCGIPSDCGTGTILIIAAGGNGGSAAIFGLGGLAATNGSGNGGSNQGTNAGGGGGVNSAGSGGGGGGIVLKTDLSTAVSTGAQGMGGGGGVAGTNSGGGGGHTGGNVNNNAAAKSFNSGTNQNNTSGANGGANPTVAGNVVCECLSVVNQWAGGTSSDWNSAANWSAGVVPSATDNVTLPATGVTNEAVISTAVTTANLTLQTGRTLTLSTGGSLTVNGILTMSGGNITLGNQNMTFGAAATVTGAAATKCIVTNGTGKVQRAIAASGSFQFPVGATVTSYNPLTIALQAGDPTETFSVRAQSSVNPSAPDNTLCVQRTWNIDETTPGGNNAKLTFQWAASDEGANFARNLSATFRHNGSQYSQIDLNGTASGSNPYTVTMITFAATTFSPFVVGASSGLPVQLVSFTGVFVNNAVRLNWRTLSEINNYGFYVQRRAESGEQFVDVPNSFVAGHGTTNEPHDYTFTDNTVSAGSWQYRLKQVDLDGTIHFTEPINVSSPTSVKELAPIEFALKQNYPNPFNPETNVKFSVEQTGRATLEIYNLLGQKVATLFDDDVEAGYYQTVKLNGSNLASGVYLYRLQSGKKSDLKKFMLLK